MPKVAVVILNWNGRKLLETFLPSVVKYSLPYADVIVADNASTDDSVAFVKEHYPEISIIQNASNGGFAKGYNECLKHVDADYYVLLNSDVEVTENWVQPVVALMEKDSSIKAVQPKILAYHQKDTFEYAGAAGGFMDKYAYPFCRGRMFDNVEKDLGQYNQNSEIFWASGCALFVRAADFHKVNGFDEAFFSHMEEIDLCWRLKNRGGKVFYCAESTIYHVGGATLSQYNPKKTYLNFRNNLFLITKNQIVGFLPLLILRRLVLDGIAGIKFLLEGKANHCWAILVAHLHFYKHLPVCLKERKVTQSLKSQINLTGIYCNWVVWQYFAGKKKKFSQLNSADFF